MDSTTVSGHSLSKNFAATLGLISDVVLKGMSISQDQRFSDAREMQRDPRPHRHANHRSPLDAERVVEHQEIARVEKLAQVGKNTVNYLAGLAPEHKQARFFTFAAGKRRDKRLRKFVIEFFEIHEQ